MESLACQSLFVLLLLLLLRQVMAPGSIQHRRC
jgi:hypothetical protein